MSRWQAKAISRPSSFKTI